MVKEILDREREDEKNIRTVLAEDIDFSGALKFSTSLKIKGAFEGEIDSTGHLYVGKGAVVKANIRARTITLYGRIEGNVETAEKIELFSGAELAGDIKTPDFIIQSGCAFNGKCIMTRKEKAAPGAGPAAPQEKK